MEKTARRRFFSGLQPISPAIAGDSLDAGRIARHLPSPHLIAEAEMPPLDGMPPESGGGHDFEQELAMGVSERIPAGEVIRIGALGVFIDG